MLARHWAPGGHGAEGWCELLPPLVPPQLPRHGAVVVGVVTVVGLGVSQQGCGWGEGGSNSQVLVCQRVWVLVCLNAEVQGCLNACRRGECAV